MGAISPTPASTPAKPTPTKPPIFDGLSFVKYMKDIGRMYRKQAMELVSICRTFAQAQEQLFRSYDDLRSVLEVVDDALGSATEAQKKASKEVDKKFKEAIDALTAYEKRCHSRETVAKKMVEAEQKDKSSSTTLNRLKEKLRPVVKEPTKIVEFLLHESLPDRNPTSVKQELGQNSNLQEILWNFSRYKDKRRLTLKQNPHFYEVLPSLPEKYGGKFRTDPIESFQFEKISVLTDNPGETGRVFLETAEETRAFGNVWVPKDAIIFKDVCGKLEGESIVGAAIQDTPNLWCFEEPLLSPTSLSPNRSSSSPTMSTTTATSSALLNGDWREPIRRMLRSLNFNVRISAKPPTNSNPSYSAPSSPIPLSRSSSNVGRLHRSPTLQYRPPITLQIPEENPGTSTGPLTLSSYRTARSTPLSQRPPAAELSPRSHAPPSPRPPSILPTQPTSTPEPSTTAPLSIPPLVPLRPPSPTGTVALAQTGPAVPAPTSCLPSDREVSREEGAILGDSNPTQTFIAEPSTGPIVTIISPLQVIGPHAERNEVEVAEHVPSFEHEVATVVASDIGAPHPLDWVQVVVPAQKRPDPPPSHQVENAVPTQKRKKHWYQKCFDILKNSLRPGSS